MRIRIENVDTPTDERLMDFSAAVLRSVSTGMPNAARRMAALHLRRTTAYLATQERAARGGAAFVENRDGDGDSAAGWVRDWNSP